MEFHVLGGNEQGTLRVEKKKWNASKLRKLLEAKRGRENGGDQRNEHQSWLHTRVW